MITAEDRESLGGLMRVPPGQWITAPPCFTPNDLCRDQERRGLIEITEAAGRVMLRLTVFGRICLRGKSAEGKISQ